MFGQQKNDEEHNGDAQSEAAGTVVTPQNDDFNPALPAADPLADVADDSNVASRPDEDEAVADTVDAAPAPNTNDLLDIKQQALSQLSPLIGHLEQSPEEKFRTTMMMIQASDNQDLVGEAFKAAQAIPDEKAKAQALLDIVNEINYFTQHHQA